MGSDGTPGLDSVVGGSDSPNDGFALYSDYDDCNY